VGLAVTLKLQKERGSRWIPLEKEKDELIKCTNAIVKRRAKSFGELYSIIEVAGGRGGERLSRTTPKLVILQPIREKWRGGGGHIGGAFGV